MISDEHDNENDEHEIKKVVSYKDDKRYKITC